jgi:hypothetical protein
MDPGKLLIMAFGSVLFVAIHGKTELTIIFDLGKNSGHSKDRRQFSVWLSLVGGDKTGLKMLARDLTVTL